MGSFVCWACGEKFLSANDLKKHFQTNHVLDVDYLICPLCGSCARDLIFHFQAHHPSSPLPDGICLRIKKVTGKQQEYLKKKRKSDKNKFKTGFFFSKKNNANIHFRSSYEEKAYSILEKAFSVKSYRAEPYPIPYFFKGVAHNYYPDIEVVFTDDSKMMVEIKPLNQCPMNENKYGSSNRIQSVNDAKWAAAQKHCAKRGITFIVWTERAIKHLGKFSGNNLTKTNLLFKEND